ncbi:histidine kinase [Pedobacter sp. GR22-6]|uniref:histidine kinase n=1 Tax=Pedobacter sp. GR22-6 TaxID=3127957 RepID=UPI00307E4FF3
MSNIVQIEINKKNRWVYFSKYRWVAHVIYWTWVLVAGTLLSVKVPITASVVFNHFILDNLLIALFYYTYCLYLIPYFFKRNRIVLFWILTVLSYLLIAAIDVPYNQYFVKLSYQNPHIEASSTFFQRYFVNLGNYLLNFVVFSMMLFFMEKNEENHTLLELEKEKKEIEQVKLDLLKTNISPDFLMRSLSQLKHSAQEQYSNTPDAILAFSDLLRYRLYSKKKHLSTLSEELDALQSLIHFIDLYNDKNNLIIHLDVQGNSSGKNIAPLSLINILEPFCKAHSNQPVILRMILLIDEKELNLEMDYGLRANEILIADLNEYGNNYRHLYGSSVRFKFENCEDDKCIISLNLPLSTQQTTV